MQLYNTGSTELSLIHQAWFLCDADINSYPLADTVRNANSSLERLVAEIIQSDKTWQWDDTNQTDLPIGTGTLVEAQSAYSFASEYLGIKGIEILDTDGSTYKRIKELDRDGVLRGLSTTEYFDSTGFPEYYELVGDTIFLYPAPTATAVTLASGIKTFFERTVDLFTISDTTQAPGIASPFHETLAYMMAIPYCMKYKKDRVGLYEKRVDDDIKRLRDFYSSRAKNVKAVMTPKKILFI